MQQFTKYLWSEWQACISNLCTRQYMHLEQHTTCVMMLCKRWTSMISANFFRNACVKNWKIWFFFSFCNKWTPMFEYPKTLITEMTIFKFWWIFLFLEGGRFVVKLVTAKVIRQHMFFFTLSYFLDNNIWNKKKWYDSFCPWKPW